MSNEEIINEAKKIMSLTPQQGQFLLDWYTDDHDKEFGFLEVKGFEEQIKMAIKTYLEIEKGWQLRVQQNLTRLNFNDFFKSTVIADGVKLSEKFINKLNGGIK